MAPATNGRLQLATGIATGYTEDGDPDGRPPGAARPAGRRHHGVPGDGRTGWPV